MCAVRGRGGVCTRRRPLKRTLRRLCECDLKPLWRGFSLAVWDAPSAYFRQIRRLSEESRAPAEAQRSGFGGKRRRSGMSEFSPLSAETSGMELAVTKSRIKGWRRNRRSAQSLLPAVRAVDGGFNAGGCGAFRANLKYHAAPCGALRHRRTSETLRGSHRVAALQADGGDGHGNVHPPVKSQCELRSASAGTGQEHRRRQAHQRSTADGAEAP